MEFALIHAPDWYIIPQPMEVGSISHIENFRVTDSFGDETLIEPAGQTKKEISIVDMSSQPWNTWSMFLLSRKYKNSNGNTNTRYFFLPPSVDNIISSPPIEEIRFLRDEIANMVWAVERKYRTLAGEPISGYDHSTWRQRKKLEEKHDHEKKEESATDNTIKYTLMTSTVPWNWIPFIPVHADKFSSEADDETHYTQIELQRAAMISNIAGGVEAFRIYPNSRLLNEVQTRCYIDESEVPRSGIILWENYQRALWSNGKVFLWIGRKKSVGSGEGSSGLRFDSIPIGNKT